MLLSSLGTTPSISHISHLGSLHYFLGIQITRSQFGLILTQSMYAFDVLHRFHMENSKLTKTPCCPSTRLLPHDGVSPSDPTKYKSMVEHFNTWPSLDLILHLVYINCANSWASLYPLIWRLPNGFSDIFVVLYIMASLYLLAHWLSLHFQMQTRLVIPLTIAPPLVFLFFLVHAPFLGLQRSKPLCLALILWLNIAPWPPLL